MSNISKAQLAAIRQQIDAALAPIALANNLGSLRCGRCTYTADTFTMKVEGRVEGGLTDEQQRYDAIRKTNHWWPERGVIVTTDRKAGHLMIDGMGKGGRVFLKDTKGTTYTWKYEALERKYPAPWADKKVVGVAS